MEQANDPILYSKQRAFLFVGDVVFFYIQMKDKFYRYLGQISGIEEKIVEGDIKTVFKGSQSREYSPRGTYDWPEELPEVQINKMLEFPEKWKQREVVSYDISLAIAPEDVKMNFPFDAKNCPEKMKPLTTRLCKENGDFVSFRVQPHQVGKCIFDLDNLPQKMEKENSWSTVYRKPALNKEIQGVLFTIEDNEFDYDCVYVYKALYRALIREIGYVADDDGIPEIYIEVLETEKISGKSMGGRRDDFYLCGYQGTRVQNMFPTVNARNIMRKEGLKSRAYANGFYGCITPPSFYTTKNMVKIDKTPYDYRSVLKNVVDDWNIVRDTVKIVKETKSNRHAGHHFFTYNDVYCTQWNYGMFIGMAQDENFMQLIGVKSEFSMYSLKPKDVVYVYDSDKKGKEETAWLVSAGVDDVVNFHDSNYYLGLDDFIVFVLSEGKAKRFKNKTPKEIVDALKVFGRDSTVFSNLIEGWFDPSISNRDVDFFKKRYMYWL